MKNFISLWLILIITCVNPVFASELISKSPKGAKLYFIEPKNGQVVSSTFSVKFGLAGMGVAPAGMNKESTGHHHLLINMDLATIDLTKPLPATDKIKHYGNGQTETTLQLSAGKHTLQLVLGNYLHIPHSQPVVSEKITITVK